MRLSIEAQMIADASKQIKDLEAQVKALKAENLEETKMFNNVVKAKEKETKLAKYRHKIERDRYLINEAIIAEKDEEIEKLRTLLMQSNRESVLIGNKIGESKARSIVAMLFWEMRKALRISNSSDVPNNHGKTTQSFYLFKKAYAMLKDNK